MPDYKAPHDLAQQLLDIKKLYLNKTNIDLDNAPEPYKLSTMVGGSKDVSKRKKQANFIIQFTTAILKLYPYNEDNIHMNPTDFKNKLMTDYFLMALCCFIQHQIHKTYWCRSSSNSKLYQLLSFDCLGLSDINLISDQKKQECFLTIRRLSEGSMLCKANQTLESEAGIPPITETEWNKFQCFLNKECNIYRKGSAYPITDFITPHVAQAFSWAGYSTGWAVGERLGDTTTLMSSKKVLTSLVTSGACVLIGGTSISTGAVLLAYPFAVDIVKNTSIVFTAGIMGEIMRFVGTATGTTVGLTLDYACKALYALYSQLRWMLADKTPDPRLANSINLDTGEVLRTIDKCVVLDPAEYEKVKHLCVSFQFKEDLLIISLGKDSKELDLSTFEDDISSSKAIQNAIKGLLVAQEATFKAPLTKSQSQTTLSLFFDKEVITPSASTDDTQVVYH